MTIKNTGFFAQQDKVRRQTAILLVFFTLAVLGTAALVYWGPALAWYFFRSICSTKHIPLHACWHPDLFILVYGAVFIVVLASAIFKLAQLRRGGGRKIGEMLGGKQVHPATDNYFERRLHNVIEEMAIASGMPVPSVFILECEQGINAFSAGYSHSDFIIGVTYGAMTGLAREELQGIIAHEFSHILNHDMKLNTSLIGILSGLVIIGVTGRTILDYSANKISPLSSRNDPRQLVVFPIIAGVILWVTGYSGIFFARLIKAAISRSRERLADAAAVQFTRNPAGLAGALKKIGGLSQGSRIRSPQAEQISHMFFANGLSRSIFDTHPPLMTRVHWLDPEFNGSFKRVTLTDLHQQLARIEGAPLRSSREKADFFNLYNTPGKQPTTSATIPPQVDLGILLASIGAPMGAHINAAQELIASIPDPAKELARDPHGARILVYFLLLDSNETVQNKQMAAIRQYAEPETFNALQKALPNLGAFKPDMHLPIIDLSIPALRLLSKTEYENFRKTLKELIMADEQVDVHEAALYTVITTHLAAVFDEKTKSQAVNIYAIEKLSKETSTILSTLALKGHETGEQALVAFEDAVATINAPRSSFHLLTECGWQELDTALNTFKNEASFKAKRKLLVAMLTCMVHDRKITVAEVELFRIIADTLGCPVPPWVAPVDLED